MSKLNPRGLLIAVLSGGLLVSACSSDSSSPGTGGAGGKGIGGKAGSSATGGSPGTGGAVGSGGTIGTAGMSGMAGATASGGAAGATSSAGSTGTAGMSGGAGVGGGSAAGAGGSAAGGSAAGGNAAGGSAAGGNAVAGSSGTAGHGGAAGGNSGTAGATAGSSGSAGSNGAAGAGGSAGGAGGGTVSPVVARGQYLANSVLGCVGCHTPMGGSPFSGADCFVKSGTQCLSSANLTNHETGIKNFTDQQIKDAITMGLDPDGGGKYLFARMPYYQFANLNANDLTAIVAYLRSLPGVDHTVTPATAPYDVPPTAAEWASTPLSALPASGAAAGPTNGKYLAALTCLVCHTADASGTTPKMLDAAKAFQGGKVVSTMINGTATMVETSNLTPDTSGIQAYNASQVATAVTMAKDRTGKSICGMRALANMTTSDATDIGTYLLAIPAVSNTITMTCP